MFRLRCLHLIASLWNVSRALHDSSSVIPGTFLYPRVLQTSSPKIHVSSLSVIFRLYFSMNMVSSLMNLTSVSFSKSLLSHANFLAVVVDSLEEVFFSQTMTEESVTLAS